jgi:hypothetical protein
MWKLVKKILCNEHGYAAAIIAAVAAVVGAATAVVSSMDTARRAEHAQEDAAAQNQILIQQELGRRQQELDAKQLQYRKTIGTLSANAGKSGLMIDDNTSPAYLLNESRDAYTKDVSNIITNSEQNIQAKNYGLGLTNSRLNAMEANAWAGAFTELTKGASGVVNSGIWSKSTAPAAQVNNSSGNYSAFDESVT